MFNTTVYKNESKVVAITKEIEKTISPDKVTEMYDAVKNEVENSIIRSFRIQSMNVDGSVIVIDDFQNHSKRFIARFMLNGKEHIIKEYIEDIPDIDNTIVERIHKYLAEEISSELIKSSAPTILNY